MKKSDHRELEVPGEPSTYTPFGRIEQARRFGMGWKSAARWKKRGLLLAPLMPIILSAIAFLVYVILKGVENLFR